MRNRNGRSSRSFRSAADLHQRRDGADVRFSAGERDAGGEPESRRGRALRSLQSIRRYLDLSLRRQLPDCSHRYAIALEHCHRIQSAEQPGQNLRQQLRPGTGEEPRLRRRSGAAVLERARATGRDLFPQPALERDRIQWAIRHAQSRRGPDSGGGGGAQGAADEGPGFRCDLHLSRRGENVRGGHQPAARRTPAAPAAE